MGSSGFSTLYLIFLIGIPAFFCSSYAVYVWVKGRPSFDRVNQQANGKLLGKRAMEIAYWSLQPVARLCAFLRIKPDHLSWTSLLFGFLAGLSLTFGHFGFGAGFAAAASVLDILDGMLARITGTDSMSGEVLDSAIDRYVEFFFLGGLALYYREILRLEILVLVTLLGSFMVSYSSLFAKSQNITIHLAGGSMRRPERLFFLVLGAALSPITIPIFEQFRDTPVPIGHPMVVCLILVAVLANSSAVEQFVCVIRMLKANRANISVSQSKEEEILHGTTEGTGNRPK